MQRPWILAAVGAVVAAAAVLLLTSTRGQYRAPPQRPAVTIDAKPAVSQAIAAPLDASPVAAAPDAHAAGDPGATAARDARDQLLSRVQASGDGRETWDDQARALFGAVGGAAVTDDGCYIAGCAATLTFRSRDEYARSLDALQASDAYRAWTGGKVLSPPEFREDGSVVTALVLYRPD